MRRVRFNCGQEDFCADLFLAATSWQDLYVERGGLHRSLRHLPQPHREALILGGAGFFAYEEAAELCEVAVGTIKSRVARGRAALAHLLEEGAIPSCGTPPTSEHSALLEIMDDVDRLSRRR